MIAVIDYGMGNLRSVEKAFLKVGYDVRVTSRPEDVQKADGVVLPGVGAFRDCMKELSDLGMTDAVVKAIIEGKPYLGICLGLQVLFSESEEFGRCRGLDIFRGRVVRFELEDRALKIPQMGWNQVSLKRQCPLFRDIPDNSYFYFVHSFYVAPDDEAVVAGTTEYGVPFTSAVWKDNIYAVQFHPEKSQALGLRLLKNFGDIVAQVKK
ncbi:MAG: imidazole glycerol phosphate synthase subunit HisH [Nitrospiraceae bacterium]|nr:MAG: imidazole glycerol phosphate synthase subunit HisH [Nitrospiraceae bacterium]